ncbi:MAG: hypothetical protein V4516_12370, partial [Pseudomonadota bacterium]
DALKRRNAAIEARFPDLKRADSPSDRVGAAVAEGFGKVAHRVRMLSLENAFSDDDVVNFDDRVRRFLGLGGPKDDLATPATSADSGPAATLFDLPVTAKNQVGGRRAPPDLAYTAEPKIDGLSLSL